MICILVRFLPLLLLFFNLTFILQSEALLFIILLQIFRIVVHQQAACPKSKCDIMVVLLAEIKMQFKFKILSSKPHGNGSSNISLSEVAFISAHKRNNKEDVTGRNEGIWPCRLVGVPLRGSSLSRSNVWKKSAGQPLMKCHWLVNYWMFDQIYIACRLRMLSSNVVSETTFCQILHPTGEKTGLCHLAFF